MSTIVLVVDAVGRYWQVLEYVVGGKNMLYEQSPNHRQPNFESI